MSARRVSEYSPVTGRWTDYYPCPDCDEVGVITDPEGCVVEDPCATCGGHGRTDHPVPVPDHLQPPPRPFE